MLEGTEESVESCRCWRKPSSTFVKLTNKSSIAGDEERTYHELFQKITNWIITDSEEKKMPQNICRKCVKELKNAYSFILQTQQNYEYYRQADNETKNAEQLYETLIEIPETKTNLNEGFQLLVKDEYKKSAVRSENTYIFSNTPRILDNMVKEEFHDESSLNENNLEDFLDEGDPADVPNSDSDEDFDTESLDIDYFSDLNEPIPCRCDVRHKVYRDERSLNIHKRVAHMPEDKKLHCPLYSPKTSRSSVPKRKKKDICHKAFKRSTEIKAHRVIHNDEKPFQCCQCSKCVQKVQKIVEYINIF